MIEMNNYLKKVKEFHEVFEHPIATNIGEETLETRQLRIKLLFEELRELAEAGDCRQTLSNCCSQFTHNQATGEFIAHKDGDNVNFVEELDALCDLQVVLSGKIITSGHLSHFEEAFDEVHRSNMSKALIIPNKWPFTVCDLAAAEKEVVDNWCDTLHKVKGHEVQPTLFSKDNKYVIFKRRDGKILKGPHFEEPNLEKFITNSNNFKNLRVQEELAHKIRTLRMRME